WLAAPGRRVSVSVKVRGQPVECGERSGDLHGLHAAQAILRSLAAGGLQRQMSLYPGRPLGARGPEKNLGRLVVLDLTRGLGACNVMCDNFFTSYWLVERLLAGGGGGHCQV
ncbi:hypothetical protein GOODEAATRI_026679, partial [Goodea atripinnis]